ncbi:hypothetical protein H0H92_003785 [Tricholoma furcatifolium]|nr:hypothetical protein H0H92_003785 [Tricholoma furcatifolium]
MDSTLYKSAKTRRNFTYSYYFSAPAAGKPVILFTHGFPSTSYDWRFQVDFFKGHGYGLIVPDLLGYGGTDKPSDYADYRLRLMSEDVIDLLDTEKIEKVIGVGHDWGSVLLSRIANYFPERFFAFGFLAVGYVAPNTVKFADLSAELAKLAGYELFGYWNFFAEEGSSELIDRNFDSFFTLLFANDPKLSLTHLTPSGALKSWIEGKNETEVASYIPTDDLEKQRALLRNGGLAGPVNWYKVWVYDLDLEDAKDLTPDDILIHKPVFLGTASKDPVFLPPFQQALTGKNVKGPLTVKEFDAAHWVLWEKKDQVNEELLAWIQGLAL